MPASPPEILVVTTSFPQDDNAGSGIFVKRLTDALSLRVRLAVLSPAGRSPRTATQDAAYPVIDFRYAPRAWQSLTHAPGGIPAALKRHMLFWAVLPLLLLGMFRATAKASRGVRLLHANWSLTGLICGLVGRMHGIPVITTLRGSDVGKLESSWLARQIFSATLRLNDRLVTVSQAMCETLAARHPRHRHKFVHIANGVDAAFFTLAPPPAATPLRLVSIGNLIPGKGGADLLTALAQVDAAVTLSVVGDGPERIALQNQAMALGLNDRIDFLGALPPPQIPAVLAAHDVLVLASHAEGRPNVLVEAMAAGRAVIATRIPGVCELVDDQQTGLLYPPGDTAALAAHIRALVDAPARCQALGAAARAAVAAQKLTWPACAEQYADLYRQILAERHASPCAA
jgi:glycosyltransferase involved in cell wall biosynthesis